MFQTKFWASQRVLLTGHTGFKGSWMTLWLERLGAQVFGFALPPDQEPNLYSQPRTVYDARFEIRRRKKFCRTSGCCHQSKADSCNPYGRAGARTALIRRAGGDICNQYARDGRMFSKR